MNSTQLLQMFYFCIGVLQSIFLVYDTQKYVEISSSYETLTLWKLTSNLFILQ